jgi:hypothetical protein
LAGSWSGPPSALAAGMLVFSLPARNPAACPPRATLRSAYFIVSVTRKQHSRHKKHFPVFVVLPASQLFSLLSGPLPRGSPHLRDPRKGTIARRPTMSRPYAQPQTASVLAAQARRRRPTVVSVVSQCPRPSPRSPPAAVASQAVCSARRALVSTLLSSFISGPSDAPASCAGSSRTPATSRACPRSPTWT